MLSSFVGTGLFELGAQMLFLFYAISSGFALLSELAALGTFPLLLFLSLFPEFICSVLLRFSRLFFWLIGFSVFYLLLSSLQVFTCEFLLSAISDSYFSIFLTIISAKGAMKSLLWLLSLF